MTCNPFYELREPTHWVEPPETYSFSHLQAIMACPRRWQLVHSCWGPFTRYPERPKPAAIEGQIVHAALELLARELGQRGRPPIASVAFQGALAACEFWSFFAAQIQTWNQRLAAHPRAGPGYLLRTKPQELANQTIRLFRETYRPGTGQPLKVPAGAGKNPGSAPLTSELVISPAELLQARGVLAEIRMRHPTLPLAGVLDAVTLDQHRATTIIDFKTGQRKPAHEAQVLLYALLWWRCSGSMPDKVALHYLDGAWSQPVAVAELELAERTIDADIRHATAILQTRPASPQPGKECSWCPVRPRCNEGWARIEQGAIHGRAAKSVDIELTLISEPTHTGYLGLHANGREYSIVYDAAVSYGLPLANKGDRFRYLDAMTGQAEREIQLRPWTEIYRL